MATHMLDNGVDIRHIQEMLGHSNLSSTQVYTKVSNQALKDVHRQTHPASQLSDESTAESDKVDVLAVLKPSDVVH